MSELLDKQTNKQAIKPPQMWNVVFKNDDFTPMDFVMVCLVQIFGKTGEQAYAITMDVHNKGKSIVGQYPKDIAETKTTMTMQFAKKCEHPLLVEMEPMG